MSHVNCVTQKTMLLAAATMIFLSSPAVAASSGCVEGNGKTQSVARELPAFQAVRVEGAFNVRLIRGAVQKVKVTADANLLPYITTEVRDRTLRLATNRSICTQGLLDIDIVYGSLERIDVAGAVDLDLAGLDAKTFHFRLDGSGTTRLAGRVENFVVKLLGASDMDAARLHARKAVVEVSGAGNASVYATDSLHATVSGSGDLIYSGSPKDLKTKVSGAGDIVAR